MCILNSVCRKEREQAGQWDRSSCPSSPPRMKTIETYDSTIQKQKKKKLERGLKKKVYTEYCIVQREANKYCNRSEIGN